jgi:hypothetical protein
MKNILLIIAMILSFSVDAQKDIRLNKTFLRVYNLQSEKLGKGRIASFSETALNLKTGGKHVIIPANNIGSIKTKHSAGNNLLIGAIIGATTGVIYFASLSGSNRPSGSSHQSGGNGLNLSSIRTTGEGGNAFVGGVGGGISGAAYGGLTIPFKNSKSYEINGDLVKWKAFTESVLAKR